MSQTMRFKNTSAHVILLDAIGLEPVKPGGEVDIPLEFAAASRTDAGSRKASVIECVAPQLKPVSEADLAVWSRTPPPPTPKSRVVTISPRAKDEAPGVKALREMKAKQDLEAKTAKKA